MTKDEFWVKVRDYSIDKNKTERIEKEYSCQLPNVLEKIVSNNNEALFFDDGVRILSYAEILNAEKDLHIDFKSKDIIPVADCGDNDFIIYDFKNKLWAKFNIVDQTIFKKRTSLAELF